MPFNGSGGTTQPDSSIYPATANTLIESAKANTSIADIYTMLANVICKDGQTTITQNIPMNSKKLTGLAAGSANGDSVRYEQSPAGIMTTTGDMLLASSANTPARLPAAATVAAHATTMDPWGARIVTLSGSAVTITDIADADFVGQEVLLVMNAAHVWTDGAVFDVQGGANYTSSAGDLILLTATAVDAFDVTIFKADGTPVVSSASGNGLNDFRLSLTTAVPVTTADVTAAGTLYCVPYKGKYIDLYTGSAWVRRASSEFSLALTLTSGKPYDVFCYDNAGTPTLEVLVWTNDTTRATALAYQDGVLVKNGDATRRYLGSLYATASNQTEDSFAKRNLWNYYNRVLRPMRVTESTGSWNYTTATFRQARATATNQLEYIQGVSEDPLYARVDVEVSNDNASAVLAGPGIGIDSTTVNSAQKMTPGQTGPTANQRLPMMAEYLGYPGAGRHTVVWGEYSTATGTTTWYGVAGVTTWSGISGLIPG